MVQYVSLLRGINVAGKNKINMQALRDLYESLGFTQVKSYIQSGNVMFVSSQRSKSLVSDLITDKITKTWGLKVEVLVKSKNELQRIIKNNPYQTLTRDDPSKLHISFLFDKVSEKLIDELTKIHSGQDTWSAADDLIYLHCPNGYGRTKLTNARLERVLGVLVTTRNFKTVCGTVSSGFG